MLPEARNSPLITAFADDYSSFCDLWQTISHVLWTLYVETRFRSGEGNCVGLDISPPSGSRGVSALTVHLSYSSGRAGTCTGESMLILSASVISGT